MIATIGKNEIARIPAMIVVRSRKRSLASAYAAGAPTIRDNQRSTAGDDQAVPQRVEKLRVLKTVWKCESVSEWGISRGGSVLRSAVLARLYRRTSRIGRKTDRTITTTTA